LTTLYAETGWLGAPLAQLGIKVAYTPIGIVLAMVFIGLPFVVRTLEPVLEDAEKQLEEVAATLGASRLQTVAHIILPTVLPALMTGAALAFARAVGEYGSVIFIAGNLQNVSEIAPLLIMIRLDEFNYAGATALAAAMLVMSFAVLLAINLLQAWSRRHG
jgi:sulfate transport system permease protein